jgi:hypothetical protein
MILTGGSRLAVDRVDDVDVPAQSNGDSTDVAVEADMPQAAERGKAKEMLRACRCRDGALNRVLLNAGILV